MNKGAVLVADALLGADFKLFLIGDQTYVVRPPSIRTICRAVREFGCIDLDEGDTAAQVLAKFPDVAQRLTTGLGCFFEEPDAAEKLAGCSMQQLLAITRDIISLISPDDFFACAALVTNVAKMAATPRQ